MMAHLTFCTIDKKTNLSGNKGVLPVNIVNIVLAVLASFLLF